LAAANSWFAQEFRENRRIFLGFSDEKKCEEEPRLIPWLMVVWEPFIWGYFLNDIWMIQTFIWGQRWWFDMGA
jgi:hypothetical protein